MRKCMLIYWACSEEGQCSCAGGAGAGVAAAKVYVSLTRLALRGCPPLSLSLEHETDMDGLTRPAESRHPGTPCRWAGGPGRLGRIGQVSACSVYLHRWPVAAGPALPLSHTLADSCMVLGGGKLSERCRRHVPGGGPARSSRARTGDAAGRALAQCGTYIPSFKATERHV